MEKKEFNKKDIIKAIYDEGRYVIYTNGMIQRKSDGSFIKMTYSSRGFKGNAQYNLFTEKYGVVTVTIKDLLKYAMPELYSKPEKIFTEDEKNYVRVLNDYDMTVKEMQEEFRFRFNKYITIKDIRTILNQ